MRRLFRPVLTTLASVLLLAVAGVGGLLWWSLPGGDLTAGIPGLSAPVEITIDADGVPRIHAGNDRDAAAALGFLHARERMFQMDLSRRAAAGELSELLGAPTLPIDRLMRTLGVRRRAEADLPALPDETRAALDAYASGVNAWIAARGRFAALEFVLAGAPRPWTPVDTLLWGKTMGMYLSGNWRGELARAGLARRLPPEVLRQVWPDSSGGPGRPDARLGEVADRLLAALPNFPDRFTQPPSASNEWAVDGNHSSTGAPLLAGDPHLGLAMPGVWYLARIETPGRVLVGATAPGVPFLVIGHNNHIAWTFTTTGADVQDLFEETPAGDDMYVTPDGPRAFDRRVERIRVRGQTDEMLAVRETRHGPVVSDLVAPRGPLLAVAMANLAPGDSAAVGLQALNDAGDVAAAGRAAALITSPVQNLLVADRAGIGLFVTGRVPRRRAGDGSMPVQGGDGAHDWIGWASGDQLPHVLAPASGRLVNANERVAPADFPTFLGSDWPGDWRARRIRALLDGKARHDVAGFLAMQTDTTSQLAADLLPRLRRVAPGDAASRRALDLLAQWDGRMAEDLPQPLIFNAWMRRFRSALLTPVGDTSASPGMELVVAALSDRGGLACDGGCDLLLSRTLAATIAELGSQYGADLASWHWGRAHQAVFAHPVLGQIPWLGGLATSRIDAPGDGETLFRAAMRPGGFDAVHGAGYRGVYDLADLDRSRFVVAPGQSGHPLSPFAWNFVQRWHDGGSIEIGTAASHVNATVRLLPEGATR